MTATNEARVIEVVSVSVPPRSWRSDWRAIKVVWRRELIRFRRDRLRMVTSLMQPLLFLFVLGTGLSSLMGNTGSASDVNVRTFLFPGVLTLAVLFTAVFSAGSIVWDREFGFLREMLVAPVGRWAIVVGKCVGGATVATFQGLVLLALAGLVGVPYNPLMIVLVVAELMLIALMITAFGVMVAARIKTFQAFMAMTQVLMLPMFFLSGALFPLNNLPTWLTILTHINPLTYAVDLVRRTIFSFIDVGLAGEQFVRGVTWGDRLVPMWLEAVIIAVMGLIMVRIAVLQFRKA
ncbi:MAG: ABC transporter permease [Candidatus Nanopelagicales bacterium]